MLYVVRYTIADGAAGRVPEVYPRHRAYLDRFAEGGELLLIGPVLPAPTGGAMSVFRSRRAAEAFPAGDPFVLEGVAVPSAVEEWDALELR